MRVTRRTIWVGLSAVLVLSSLVPTLAMLSEQAEAAGAPGSILINEFSSDNSPEWIELFNTTGVSVNLTHWYIKDLTTTQKSLTSLGSIPAGGFVTLDIPSGYLNNGGDSIGLFDETNQQIDLVEYGAVSTPNPMAGESTGRTTDGAATWNTFAAPTKGISNGGATTIPPCGTGVSTFDAFDLGSVNGQSDWSATGPHDQTIVDNTFGYSSFGCKSLRFSNSVTSRSYSDQVFSYSAANEAGEASAESGGLSGGARQNYFEAQWDIASVTPGAQQIGLNITASPDRGDGARMSWIQMVDGTTGLDINFYDYQSGAPNTGGGDGFVFTNIASGLDRSGPHTIKVTMELVDGTGNDVVKVYVDGELVHTGTSWEDYFREQEENPTRTVDSILFRASGPAAPALAGNGYLFDNVLVSTSTLAPDTTRPTVELEPGTPGAFTSSGSIGIVATDDVKLDKVVGNIRNSSGRLVKSTQSPANGVNPYTHYASLSGLTDGTYNLRYNATDKAGNLSQTKNFDFIIDNTKPSAKITSPLHGDVKKGSFAVEGTASDATSDIKKVLYTVNKINEIGGTYVASVTNGTATYDGTADTFEFPVSGLTDGYYRLKIQAFDNAGNWKYHHIDVQVDTTRPVTEVLSPSTEGLAYSNDFNVDIRSTDGQSGIVQATANLYKTGVSGPIDSCVNQQVNPAENEYFYTCSVDVDSLGEGDYYLKINTADAAGNISNTIVWDFTVDKTAPSYEIKSGSSYTRGQDDVYSIVSFKLFDAHMIDKVEINGHVKSLTDNKWSDVNYVKPGTFGAVEGSNTIVIFDVAGNTTSYSFALDTTAPVADITSHNDGDTVSGTADFVGEVTDEHPMNTYFRIEKADGTLVKTSQYTDGRLIHSFSWDSTSVPDGEYNVYFEVRDLAQNKSGSRAAPGISVEKITITVDNTGPIVDAGSVAGVQSTPFAPGATASDPSGIASYFWTIVSGSGVVSFSDESSLDPTITPKLDGEYVLQLTVVDNQGNMSFDTLSFEWGKPGASLGAGTTGGSSGAGRGADVQKPAPAQLLNTPANLAPTSFASTQSASSDEQENEGTNNDNDDKDVAGASTDSDQPSDQKEAAVGGDKNFLSDNWYWLIPAAAGLGFAGYYYFGFTRKEQ